MEQWFQAVGKDFGDDFVACVTEANMVELANNKGSFRLWNKGNEGVIDFLENVASDKKASYSFNELMVDHNSVMLVKQRRHTIRARGLVGAETKKGLFYFCRARNRAYSNIVFLSDNRAYKACNIIKE
jgi:hypothetical protein